MEILVVALRAAIIYLFIILAIRIFGKKELTQLSVLDLVFILLISNAVQNAMVGSDNSLVGGIAAASGLFIINTLLEKLFIRVPGLRKLVEGDPLMLIYKGKVMTDHLRMARMTMDELDAAVREHGVENISNVDLAVLEIDGNISILSDNYQKKTTRKRRSHKIISKED